MAVKVKLSIRNPQYYKYSRYLYVWLILPLNSRHCNYTSLWLNSYIITIIFTIPYEINECTIICDGVIFYVGDYT